MSRMENVSEWCCRENRNSHFMFKTILRKSYHVWIMWKNSVERGRLQMTIWRIRIPCWILKATNIHSEYVILIALQLQQWLHESTFILPYTYTAYLVYDSHIQHVNILCWHNVKFHIKARDTYCCLWEKWVIKCTERSYIFLVSFVFITDVPRHRAFSPVFIYSVSLYVVVNIMSFLSARESVLHLFKEDDNISVTVFNILLIVLLSNCICVPVLAWIDTPKFVQYLNKWEQFQVSSNCELV
jgi:hypothetical protein